MTCRLQHAWITNSVHASPSQVCLFPLCRQLVSACRGSCDSGLSCEFLLLPQQNSKSHHVGCRNLCLSGAQPKGSMTFTNKKNLGFFRISFCRRFLLLMLPSSTASPPWLVGLHLFSSELCKPKYQKLKRNE